MKRIIDMNKVEYEEYITKVRRENLRHSISNRIRGTMKQSLLKNEGDKRWENEVGYTYMDLKKHLKKTLPKGYCWQDYMEGRLHLDHIIPVSAFGYADTSYLNFKICWALSNLQLLPAKENMQKHDKLYKPFQLILNI